MEKRHTARLNFREPDEIEAVAKEAGLDVERLRADAADPALLANIAADFETASPKGVFGTPTFVFENGQTFFMRIKAPDDAAEAERIFDALYEVHVKSGAVDEVKHPHPPED